MAKTNREVLEDILDDGLNQLSERATVRQMSNDSDWIVAAGLQKSSKVVEVNGERFRITVIAVF